MGKLLPFLPLLPLVFTLSGCARAQARTEPLGPPLDIPAPPPREIAILEVEPPPPPPAPEEPVRTQPPRPRPAPPRVEAAKPEPVPETTRRPEEVAKPAGSTTLQTTPTGAEGELERAIRDALGRAAADLARTDDRGLSADARSQYDTARRFMQQAEDALRVRNLVFGKNLADKAASLAAQLGGR